MISIKQIDLRYSDTDQMGVIYHANYLSFFEQARTQFYRDVGFEYHETEGSGVIFPVRHVDVTYLKPMRFGEKIHIKTRVHEISRIKVTYYHEMYNEHEELKAKAYTTVVSVDKETFKTIKMDERLPDVYRVYTELIEKNKD